MKRFKWGARRMHPTLHIALFAPRIAQNTGQIARTCFAMNLALHLIRPLGFRIDGPALRRAAVGHWHELNPTIHASGQAFWNAFPDPSRVFLVTRHGRRAYTSVDFHPGDTFLFGNETEGLPPEWLDAHADRTLAIPMARPEARCLNLASAASAVMFEAIRQLGPPSRTAG
jgi:tRNA (cytidine/uridine-2'-O-)-methyltransferase